MFLNSTYSCLSISPARIVILARRALKLSRRALGSCSFWLPTWPIHGWVDMNVLTSTTNEVHACKCVCVCVMI